MKTHTLLYVVFSVGIILTLHNTSVAQNVGIGTTTPANTLEIKSSVANTSGLRFTNLTSASMQSVSNNLGLSVDANGDVILVPVTASNGWLLTGNSNATATSFLGTTNAFDLIFKAANAEYMRILNTNGNVGIGTATPTEKLDVAGNLKFSGALMPNNSSGTVGQVLTSAGVGVAPTWVTITTPTTTVSNTIAGNNLTTTVNGVAGTAVVLPTSPATTNTLGSAVNNLTSTVDGIAATAPMVNSVSNTITGNNLTTTVNGVTGTAVALPTPPATTNTLVSTVNTLTSSVDGIIATAPMVNSVSNTIAGNNLTTTVNGVTGTAVTLPTSTTTNVLGSAVNTLTSTVNGIATTALMVNSVSNTITGNNLTTTVNGVAGTAVTLPATTNTLGSAVNTLTSTVDGIAATAQIINNVSNTLTGTNLTTTVNGVASTNLDLSPIISNDWKLLGNAGTTAGTNFLGTTDAQDIVLKTNNVENLRILNANGNVGIGTSIPAQKLDVAGNVKFSGALMPNNLAGTAGNILLSAGVGVAPTWLTAGTIGQVLTSAGAGVAPTWTTASGWSITGNAGTSATTNFIGTTDNVDLVFKRSNQRAGLLASSSTSFGVGALNPVSTGGFNTAIGANSMVNNVTGGFNTAIGSTCLVQNISGTGNVSIGYASMLNNTTGGYNTGVGYVSLYNNTSGTDNVGIGYGTLYSNVVGTGNTAIGNYSANSTTGIGNTGLGNYSMYLTTSGNHNTAIGQSTLYLNGTGIENTVLGYSAGYTNSTGDRNTLLGTVADVASGALSNSTAVGYNTVVNASNKVRIGSATVTVVEGPVAYTFSDGRFKTNVTNEVQGLAFINKLRPVVYNLDTRKIDEFLTKNMPDSVRNARLKNQNYAPSTAIRQSGFIAQEVEQAAKECGYNFNGVHVPENPNDNYSVSYQTLVVPMVKAIQEQQQQIELLKAKEERIKNLEQQLEQLNAKFELLLKNK